MLLSAVSFAGQYKAEGRIVNSRNGAPLSYASVRVQDSGKAAIANSEGRYRLSLQPGNYSLIVSYPGFASDTLLLDVHSDITGADFRLKPVSIRRHTRASSQLKDPANEIIRNLIAYKIQRQQKLSGYECDAYKRATFSHSGVMKGREREQSVGSGNKPGSLPPETGGIIESLSRLYFMKPGKSSESVTARSESAGLSPVLNLFAGNLQAGDFYNDEIMFLNRPLLSPLAQNALSFYNYNIVDTLLSDNTPLIRLFFSPVKKDNPGFEGYLYISDSTYRLLRADVRLNSAAGYGGIIEYAAISQQFMEYEDDIYLPLDYRLNVRFNLPGTELHAFELITVMDNYRINTPQDAELFNGAFLTVVPGADKKDSLFRIESSPVPFTEGEISLYKTAEAIEAYRESLWEKIILNAAKEKTPVTDEFSILSPLSFYRFNSVEGHALSLGAFTSGLFNNRVSSGLRTDYGFADRKMKGDFSIACLMGTYRTYSISLNIFNRLDVLFPESSRYNDFAATALALLTKYEFRDYYYSRGFKASVKGELLPALSISAGFLNRTDNTAVNNSDFSLLAKKKSYRINPPVYETKINQLTLGIGIDSRSYYEDGYFRQRVTYGKSYVTLTGEVNLSRRDLLRSGLNYTSYSLNLEGALYTFRYAKLNFRASDFYSSGAIPYQMMHAVPGNINLLSRNYTFRTLGVAEIYGDRVGMIFLEHNWADEFFRLTDVPVLSSVNIQLTTYLNAVWSRVSPQSALILPHPSRQLIKPLIEAGFSLGHILFPFRLEFTWRLSHRKDNGFTFGLNTFTL